MMNEYAKVTIIVEDSNTRQTYVYHRAKDPVVSHGYPEVSDMMGLHFVPPLPEEVKVGIAFTAGRDDSTTVLHQYVEPAQRATYAPHRNEKTSIWSVIVKRRVADVAWHTFVPDAGTADNAYIIAARENELARQLPSTTE